MKIVQTKPYKTVLSAVTKYNEFISPTYGPAGKRLLIATNPYQVKAADDGHEGSKEFELENEFENAVIEYVKETTEHINSHVGDGRATAVILMSAIVKEVLEVVTSPLFDPKKPINFHKQAVEVKEATKEAIQKIRDKAKTIKTEAELYKVALNSYNNSEIAKLVSETIYKIGVNGQITIEDSQSVNTTVEKVSGIELEKGIASPYLKTDENGATMLNPKIAVFGKRIESFSEIAEVVKDNVNNPLMFIAESFSDEVLDGLAILKQKGMLVPTGTGQQGLIRVNSIAVEAPGFGENRQDNLKDIALITGAQIINGKEELDALYGSADKVVCLKNKTTILGGKGDKKSITEQITALQESIETKSNFEKDQTNKRIAVLGGGIAIIKVGAVTEKEQSTKKGKVSDAVNATKIAFKDGVVKGGGKTYSEIKTKSTILNNALKAPLKQLEENGVEFLDDNVTDPAGVLIASLETASSIACELIEFGGIITNKRKEEKEANF